MQYALLVDGVVRELIPNSDVPIAERYHPDFVAQLAEVDDDVREGWAWNGTEFAEPEPPAPPALSRIITPREFMDRLPMERQAAITAAAMASPEILLWLIRLTGALEVDLDNPETMEGVQTLAMAEIITEAEAEALLA